MQNKINEFVTLISNNSYHILLLYYNLEELMWKLIRICKCYFNLRSVKLLLLYWIVVSNLLPCNILPKWNEISAIR